MKYCKRCVMPDTRPGIVFDDDGVCSACNAYEKRKLIDWESRYKELEQFCDKYRGCNGNAPDSIIAVSGGKDSHFQTHLVKEVMRMNPLLVSVEDNFPMTEAGKHNLRNISEEFGCDIITIKPNRRAQKRIMRMTFEKYGMPTYYIDRLIYTFPLHMAAKFNTPMLVYGENVSYEYGGQQQDETYSARAQIDNGVASGIPLEELIDDAVSLQDLSLCEAPNASQMAKLDPIYISYFVPWNSYRNYIFAKSRGFHDLSHEWMREHHIEQFDQVDTRAYLVHPWLKYPKYGHASATDYASRFIRYGLLTREQGIKLVQEHDHKLDNLALRDFCEFTGYTAREFWDIVDRHYNRDIFERNEFGAWQLKNPVWKQG